MSTPKATTTVQWSVKDESGHVYVEDVCGGRREAEYAAERGDTLVRRTVVTYEPEVGEWEEVS